MRPLEPVAPSARIGLGLLFFGIFVAAWSLATLGGFVSRTFLADPLTMLADGWALVARFGFLGDIAV
ncbi:MAG: ABC transporter permease, partial [Methylobacteriaceae bacterium]|nr:ABC transporter permease [Methylobacteriaceae bacterium]